MFKNRLLSAACLSIAFSLPAAAGELPGYPFIHATGTAYSFVMPDLGEIDFEVSAVDPSPEAATTLVQTRITEIKALLMEQGLPEAAAGIDVRDLRKADAMARGFGKRVGAVAGISSDQLKYLGNSVGLAPSDRTNRANKRERQNPEDMLAIASLKMSQTVDALFRIK